jgi:hypothetical protein
VEVQTPLHAFCVFWIVHLEVDRARGLQKAALLISRVMRLLRKTTRCDLNLASELATKTSNSLITSRMSDSFGEAVRC